MDHSKFLARLIGRHLLPLRSLSGGEQNPVANPIRSIADLQMNTFSDDCHPERAPVVGSRRSGLVRVVGRVLRTAFRVRLPDRVCWCKRDCGPISDRSRNACAFLNAIVSASFRNHSDPL